MLVEGLERADAAQDRAARIGVEFLAVRGGIKPSGRFTASRKSAAELVERLKHESMCVDTYDPDPLEWGYRRATLAERDAATRRDIRVYYACTPAALDAAMQAQVAKDDDALGLALGYPPCCIAANAVLGTLEMTDMVRVARCPGNSPDWRLNLFLTELEVGAGSPWYLISHFPCSLSCAQSIAYASAVLAELSATVPGFAARLEDALRLPVLVRDERDPPEARRYGNSGAILHGMTVAGTTCYSGWVALRNGDTMVDAGLAQGHAIRCNGADLEVLGHGERIVARLDRLAWALVPFS